MCLLLSAMFILLVYILNSANRVQEFNIWIDCVVFPVAVAWISIDRCIGSSKLVFDTLILAFFWKYINIVYITHRCVISLFFFPSGGEELYFFPFLVWTLKWCSLEGNTLPTRCYRYRSSQLWLNIILSLPLSGSREDDSINMNTGNPHSCEAAHSAKS